MNPITIRSNSNAPRDSTGRADGGTLPSASTRSVTNSTLVSSVKPFSVRCAAANAARAASALPGQTIASSDPWHGADPRARGPQGMSALDLAVSGVPDIDRFTVGDCKGATIQALIERAPDMKLSGNARVLREFEALKLKGCAGVAQLEGRRFVSR